MQYTVHNFENGRKLVQQDPEGKISTLRICTENQIDSMSSGSFKLYRQKISQWFNEVHLHGTPEAIRTIDFLKNACQRSKNKRTRQQNPPVC